MASFCISKWSRSLQTYTKFFVIELHQYQFPTLLKSKFFVVCTSPKHKNNMSDAKYKILLVNVLCITFTGNTWNVLINTSINT